MQTQNSKHVSNLLGFILTRSAHKPPLPFANYSHRHTQSQVRVCPPQQLALRVHVVLQAVSGCQVSTAIEAAVKGQASAVPISNNFTQTSTCPAENICDCNT